MKTKMQDMKPNTRKQEQEYEHRQLWALTMLVAGLSLALIK